MKMKKILYMICAVLLLAGCDGKNGNKKDLTEQLYGDWHRTSISATGDLYVYTNADIYISFLEDKTFELYQKMGEGAYRLYRGVWNVEEGLLTGRYNDGEDWTTAYRISIEDHILTMKSDQNNSEITETYASEAIPEEIKNGCEVVVKSVDAGF